MIKKLTTLTIGIALAMFVVPGIIRPAGPVHADGPNLVANPGAETVNGTLPASWQNGKTGTNNAAFIYPTTSAHSGTRSLRVQTTSYTDGDAKWFFDPVDVTPGGEYRYTGFYRANVKTDVWARYTSAGGVDSFVYLGSVPINTNWAATSFYLKAPADAAKATVMHILSSNGALVVDDVSLATTQINPVPPPANNSLVANESLELASDTNPNVPASWTPEGFGSNNRIFQHMQTGGHTGSRSAKVTISNYVDGDAKWSFTPIAVTPSTEYEVSVFYKATVPTRLMLVSYDASNNPTFTELNDNLPISTVNWKEVSNTFTTPTDSQKITVLQSIGANGWLQVDDLTVKKIDVPAPTSENLITNPSLESTVAGKPYGWQSNKFGNSTATFSYLTSGHTGTRSVKTQVSNYVDGDAKWFFNPVPVTTGKVYRFDSWYKSTQTSQAMLRYTSASGVDSYVFLGTVPNSHTGWSKLHYVFTAPNDVAKVTVMHILANNGWLVVDDYQLTEAANPVPNPSVEDPQPGQPNLPRFWTTNSWGTNTASFQYIKNSGHTGTSSVKATVSNYVDGDAKWLFDPQNLTPGKSYRFKAWYKTNTVPHVVARYVTADGTEKYYGMPDPFPGANASTTWQQYTDTFTVPTDAVSTAIMIIVSSNGWVQTDDYEIEPYTPTAFTRPLVTLTFDDGFESNITSVLPVLTAKNFKSTQCYTTQFAETAPNTVNTFKNAGHEVCSHSVTHPFLTQVDDTTLNYELQHSQQVLTTITGNQIPNFASPYGDYDAHVNQAIAPLYRSHRTTDEGYNSKDNFNAYRLRVQNMQMNTTLAEYQSWLDYAKATNTWLILIYHKVATPAVLGSDNENDDTEVGQYDTTTADFNAQMNALAASGVTVKTTNAALDELTPQLP